MTEAEAVEQFKWVISEIDEVVFPEAIEALRLAIRRFSPPQHRGDTIARIEQTVSRVTGAPSLTDTCGQILLTPFMLRGVR